MKSIRGFFGGGTKTETMNYSAHGDRDDVQQSCGNSQGPLITTPQIYASIEDQSGSADGTQKATTSNDEATKHLAAESAELERMRALLRKSEGEKMQLVAFINEYRVECERLSNDNTSLRAHIVNTRSSQDPINDDAYYTQRLTRLNEIIKSWVPTFFKSKQLDRDLTDDEEERLLQFLGRGRQRDQELQFFSSKGSIRTIFQAPRRRMALVRHILSIFLCDDIFGPFCFGLSPETDLMMKHVLKSTMENGNIYLKHR